MVEEIRDLRIKIDGLAKLAESLKPLNNFIDGEYNSQEINDTVQSLYLAKAWLERAEDHLLK